MGFGNRSEAKRAAALGRLTITDKAAIARIREEV